MSRRVWLVAGILAIGLGTGVPSAVGAIDEFWTIDARTRGKSSTTAEALLRADAGKRSADVAKVWERGVGDPVYIAVAALEDPTRTTEAVALVADLVAAAPADASERSALRPFASMSPNVAQDVSRLADVKTIRDALRGARVEGADELERRLLAIAQRAPASSLAAVEALLHAGRAATHRRDVASARRHWFDMAARARAMGWSRAALDGAVRAARAAIEAGDRDAALGELQSAIGGPLGDRSTTCGYLARHDALGILLARRDWSALLNAATTYDAWVRDRQPESSRAPFLFARARAALGLGRRDDAAETGEAAVETLLRGGNPAQAARYAADLIPRLRNAGRPAGALRIGERLRGVRGIPEAIALQIEVAMLELLIGMPSANGLADRFDAAIARADAAGRPDLVVFLRRTRVSIDVRAGRTGAALDALLVLESDDTARRSALEATLDGVRIAMIALDLGRWDLVETRIEGLASASIPKGHEFEVATRARIDVLHGSVLARRGDDGGAAAAFDRAVEATRLARDRFLGTALRARAAYHLAAGRPERALADAVGAAQARLAESIDLFEEDDWREGSGHPAELGIGIAAADHLAVSPATSEAAAEGVHSLIDAVRGRALRRVLLADGTAPPSLAPELAAAETSSAEAVAAARAVLGELESGATTDEGGTRVARLVSALARRDEVLATIRRTGGLAAFGLEPPTAPLVAVREALGADVGFVAWYAAPNLAGALVVRRTGASWIALPQARSPDALRELSRWAHARTDDAKGEPALARATAKVWFEPLVRALAGARTLIVSLDPRMGSVPIDAWIDSARSDDVRLVHRFAVANVPGAGAWLALRGAAPTTPSGVFAVGRPLPAPSGFEDLPASEGEARDVAGAAAPVERTLLTGEAATLVRVTETLASKSGAWRWIHVAAHGVPDAARPRSGGILLARGERLDGDRLFRMRVPAAVVVLSACESGVDETGAAEGPLSLARPWLVAGASRVVTALGEVPDAATSELMVRFARGHLSEGLPPAEALAAAKRAAIAGGGAGATPRVWAAFVLHGLP